MSTFLFSRATAAATLLAAATLISACGGGGGAATAPTTDSLRAARPGEVLSEFKSRMARRSERYASPSPMPVPVPGTITTVTGADSAAATFSGTNLQVAGVDEDDLIKTDGAFIHALYPSHGWGTDVSAPRLESRRILADGSLGAAHSLRLGMESAPSGMYLAGDLQRLAVVGRRNMQVSLDLYAVGGDAAPAPAARMEIDGNMVSTRRIGNTLYLATSWTPDLYRYFWPMPQPAAPAASAASPASPASNASRFDSLTLPEVMPTVRVNGQHTGPLVSETDCYLHPADASLSLQITTVTAIDLSTPALERRSVCFIGDGATLYMSPESVYVASSQDYWITADFAATIYPSQVTTSIHKFALDGLAYRGSGKVPGHLGWDREKMPYRMSEYQGDLRVVTFTGEQGWVGMPMVIDMVGITTQVTTATLTSSSTTSTASDTRPAKPSPATLTILREGFASAASAAPALVKVASLPNDKRPAALGKEGEQVYAVQFAGPQAYIVTFRRVDPLYVLDLSDPSDPRAAGELEVPGFSDYLFPLANGKLLGVGKNATDAGLIQGLKIALFDVSDPASPALLASYNLGGRGTTSALDSSRHGINILQQGSQARIALPVSVVEGEDWYSPLQGLARYRVDTQAGTLQERPMLGSVRFNNNTYAQRWGQYALWNERSIQSDKGTYYLSGGKVTFTPE